MPELTTRDWSGLTRSSPEPSFLPDASALWEGPLPFGRRAVDRRLVLEHQRCRLIRAVAQLYSQHGEQALTVTRIRALAGVGDYGFYDSFPDTAAALMAAYEYVSGALFARLGTVCRTTDTREERVAGCVDALAGLASEPHAADVWFVGAFACDPLGPERHLEETRTLGAILARATTNPADSLNAVREHAAAGGVLAVAARAARTRNQNSLREAAPDIVRFVVNLLGEEPYQADTDQPTPEVIPPNNAGRAAQSSTARGRRTSRPC